MSDTAARVSALHAELERLAKLPPNSSYAQHRTLVARRALQLLSAHQRSASDEDELLRLLCGLAL